MGHRCLVLALLFYERFMAAMLLDIFSNSFNREPVLLEIYLYAHEARLLLLSASRLDVRWFIYSVRTYNFDPSNRSSDRTSKLFTSLDRSGNSLAAHLPFCHLCSLHCVERSRKAKNGTACEIGTEGRESLPFRASDRCVIHGF